MALQSSMSPRVSARPMRIRAIGVLATTSAHGAQSASKTDWTPLAGRHVHIHPDANDAGEAYAADSAAILTSLSPPATVKIVRLPGLEPGSGDDAVEWIAARRDDGKDDDAIRAEVEALGATTVTQGTPALPPAAPAQQAARTVVEVIHDYLARRYEATFRRGPNIWANALGREVTRAEAVAAPTSDLIPRLLAAIDFPARSRAPDRARSRAPTGAGHLSRGPIYWPHCQRRLTRPRSPTVRPTTSALRCETPS